MYIAKGYKNPIKQDSDIQDRLLISTKRAHTVTGTSHAGKIRAYPMESQKVTINHFLEGCHMMTFYYKSGRKIRHITLNCDEYIRWTESGVKLYATKKEAKAHK